MSNDWGETNLTKEEILCLYALEITSPLYFPRRERALESSESLLCVHRSPRMQGFSMASMQVTLTRISQIYIWSLLL